MFPKKLSNQLAQRKANNSLRALSPQNDWIDFASNDYLGFSKSQTIFKATHALIRAHSASRNGATGSRLLSGNHPLLETTEALLCSVHRSESALVCNSGYDANIGLLACVPQRGDLIFYDALSHASIRDGIALSKARAYKFRHNDLMHLEKLLKQHQKDSLASIYIVTESVFSMDGDMPDLERLTALGETYEAHIIVDEAHAVGTWGPGGAGRAVALGLESRIFARIMTFGKALGCHGAAILGAAPLRQFLINFSRSLIYTTALPPHSLATIHSAYTHLATSEAPKTLTLRILFFKSQIIKHGLETHFVASDTSIQSCIISGNSRVRCIASKIQSQGYDIKPILSPSVPKGRERLRFCIHSYNSEEDITAVLDLLMSFLI